MEAFDLDRFVEAQADVYEHALVQICAGEKRSHWMWFIFPQLAGLGASEMAWRYGLRGSAEADAYLKHPLLGPRLIECAEAALAIDHRTAQQIFGTVDAMKLRSCATLFASVSSEGSVFHRLLVRYFGGKPDPITFDLLRRER